MTLSRPLSVLYFTEAVARGGAEEHVLMLARGLDRGLFRVHLVCPRPLAARLAPDMPADVELVALDLTHPLQLHRLFRLARLLRSRRIDILHSHGFYSSLLASPAGCLSRVPVIVETSHGREAWRKGWKARFFVDRAVGRLVDRYIAVSQANARYLVEQKGLPARKIQVIYPGSDLGRFSPSHPVPAGLRASLGFQEEDPVLVMVGRLEPQKGHSVLLEAFAAVRREFPAARLVCVGEGVLRAELERRTRALSLEESVRFVGYAADLRDWLALADLTLLPSFHEGLPVTPIESLASERAVVATAVDGTPEVILDGRTGLTVPPGDPPRLAAAICRLLRAPDLRRKLARAGREWVTETFGVERLIERTQEFYLDCWRKRETAFGLAEKEAWG